MGMKISDLSRAGRPVKFKGKTYRSMTEARWAVFFTFLEIGFEYEPERIPLDSGETYLPDFRLDINVSGYPDPQTGMVSDYSPVWFEVKPDSDGTIISEADRPSEFSKMQGGRAVWIAKGPPSKDTPNILRLEMLGEHSLVQETGDPSNYWQFLEDRRDDKVYWILNDLTGQPVGGPGIVTNHERLPILGSNVERAYDESVITRFG